MTKRIELSHSKVLILAYFFPPTGGSGVQRTIRYVKYLPGFGWQPYVVSARNSIGAEGYDETLLKKIDTTVPVRRVPAWPDEALRKRLKHLLDYTDKSSDEAGQGSDFLSLVVKIVGTPLVPVATPFPDPQVYWAALSIWRCLQVIMQHKVDLIYTSSPPWSTHLAGLVLKALTGRPLAVDFRDPWTLNAMYPRTGKLKALDEYLERLVLRRADLVICNHQPMRDDFIKLASPCDPHKFIVITNGYDADDFCFIPPIKFETPSDGEIVIAHIGLVYPEAALPLLKAMDLLYQEDHSLLSNLKVRFVGGLAEPDRNYLAQRAWHQRVEVIERQPHKVAIAHMRQADVLLLLLGDDEAWRKCYPGKMFEYFRSNKPILAIMPSGIATELVTEAGVGISFEPFEIRPIADQLRRLATDITGFRDVHYRPRSEVITQYDARTLTARLASAFNDTLSATSRLA